MADDTDSGLVRITYVKSSIGYSQRQKDTVRSLGLKRLGESVIQADTPAVRGMVRAVTHLVAIEPVEVPEVTAEKSNAKRRSKP